MRTPARRTTSALKALGGGRPLGADVGFPDLPPYLQGMPWPGSMYALEFPKAAALVPIVYTCITRIAEDIAKHQPTFYRVKANGEREKIERQKGNITDRWLQANPLQNAFQLEVSRQASMDMTGTGYLYIDRHKISDPSVIDLWNLPGHMVEVVPGPGRIPLGYLFSFHGARYFIDFEDLIPFPHWHPEGDFAGLSPLEAARISYETRWNAGLWNQQFYKKGAQVAGVYTTTERARSITAKDAKAYQEELRAKFMGIDRAFDPVILDGLKFERAGITHKEMAFLETGMRTDADVCRVYKVQPAMVGIHDGAKLGDSGDKVDYLQHIESCLGPRWKMRDLVLTEWFCPLFGEDIIAETDTSHIPAIAEQMLNLATLAANLVGKTYSLNEARAVTGKPPTGKPEDDEVRDPVAEQAKLDAAAAAADAGKPEPKPKPEDAPEKKSAPAVVNLRAWGLELRDDSDDLLEDEQQDILYLEKELARLIKARGTLAAAEIGVKLSIDAHALSVQRYVQGHAGKAITRVNATTRAKLREVLIDMTGPGSPASYEDITRAIDKVFAGRRANVLTIARTEALPAYNFGTLEGWRQSGEVAAKVWSTANDEVVRHAHNALEGVEVAMGDVWTMTGDDNETYACEYPGDDTLPPELKINCRCTVEAVLTERAAKALGYTMSRVAKKDRAEAMLALSETHVRGIFRRMLARQKRRVQARIDRRFNRSSDSRAWVVNHSAGETIEQILLRS